MLLYDENMDNKMLQKKRIMQYFIDSAEYIIDKEGIDNITIRKVASLAGYNSATLYNYFENLDHLIFVVGLNHLENYHNALPNYIKDCENSLEFYMEVCRCFFEFSYAEPELYMKLFFRNLDKKYEKYAQEYYDLFPEKGMSQSSDLSSFLRKNNLYDRSLTMLKKCVSDGILTHEGAGEFNEIAMLICYGQLMYVIHNFKNAETATEESMKYYKKIISSYINPEFKHLLDNIR